MPGNSNVVYFEGDGNSLKEHLHLKKGDSFTKKKGSDNWVLKRKDGEETTYINTKANKALPESEVNKDEKNSTQNNGDELIANNKAKDLLNTYTKIEPEITKHLITLVQKNGGKMEGLDFRLKTLESLKKKIVLDGINEPIKDVLRYTVILDVEFTNGVNTIREVLETSGYKTIKVKNSFKQGEIYKGVNTNVKSPDGHIFEIQYHTSESFNVKQNINHALYEQYRIMDKRSFEAIKLYEQMLKNSNSVKLPEEVNTIK